MDFYSIWPYLLCTVVILLFACSPLLTWADQPPTDVPGRNAAIDGLRSFLALGVFFSHAAVYHQYILTGRWALTPSRFYTNIGQMGVTLFFMITGYLFWSQSLNKKGTPNLTKLYLGRLFRIVPLYWFLAFVVIVVVGFMTDWQINQSPIRVMGEVAKWATGGIITGGAINGFDAVHIVANVTWTLRYEWIFYASLALTSVFARRLISGILLPLAGVLLSASFLQLNPNNQISSSALMFSIGMLVAAAKLTWPRALQPIPRWVLSFGVVTGLVGPLFVFDGIYGVAPITILGLAFALIVSNADVFGLLATRPAKRLGDISYGIYLLQGPVLFLVFEPPAMRAFAAASAWAHWAVTLLAGLCLVLIATVTHGLIERPGIKAGQWVWLRLGAMRRETGRSISNESSAA